GTAVSDEAGGACDERDVQACDTEVSRRRRLRERRPYARMRYAAALDFAKGVVDARLPQIESVVVRQRQEVEAERGERVQRFGRREKAASAAGHRLSWRGDRSLEVREDDVAAQQRPDRRDRSGSC